MVAPQGPPADLVAQLPPIGSPKRWPWLQELRRQGPLPLEPWLAALESGLVSPEPDLMAILADHLDGPAMARLLRWWLLLDGLPDPALPPLLVPRREPQALAALRQACTDHGSDPQRLEALLPLLGHQRDPDDFPLLQRLALTPLPLGVRQAALEGMCRGLAAWPLPALRQTLLLLAKDLHPPLAAVAVDALARLPDSRPALLSLSHQPLDPAVGARVARRLRGLPPNPLVLLIHGRSGGVLPPEMQTLAAELQERRGAPVILETLTGEDLPPLQPSPAGCTTLVPLFLLPGGHVRRDVPRRVARWRAAGAVRALPFLGAWPAWQAALAEEVKRLAAPTGAATALLVHHPVEGSLPQRYLDHLATLCGARCLAVPYSWADGSLATPLPQGPALPMALAASRLTEGLGAWLGPPLLARPHCRQGLLELLVALP
ncbi:MAG: CbiX/SirB N-terminal domain-containing protein [Cyanobacteriota bacterium]|nr:CbiX/SirB N-terminal domain-containing protein [Cyanobacteriota bacterium]